MSSKTEVTEGAEGGMMGQLANHEKRLDELEGCAGVKRVRVEDIVLGPAPPRGAVGQLLEHELRLLRLERHLPVDR